MSRFFETLKEVNRSQLVPDAIPPKEQPEAARTSTPDIVRPAEIPIPSGVSVELEQPEPVVQPIPPRPVPEFPRVAFSPEDLFDSIAPRREGLSGKPVKVSIDKKEPMIPHAADVTIVEQYRKLRTKIQQQHATTPINSLLVASPGPGEGKTVTLMNLALSFAMLPSFKVLVVDGDLRKGTVGRWLGLKKLPGLSNLVEGSAGIEDVILKAEELPFHFLLSGTSAKPAAELLHSPALRESIRRLTQHFDLVLMDSPPVNLMTDAQMLALSCDAVIMIARAFTTTTKAMDKALADLSSFRIVGTVLNGAMRQERRYYYKRYGADA